MSRQNKQAQRKIIAVAITELHKLGKKGPAKTSPKHGKKFENTLKYKKTVQARAKDHEDHVAQFGAAGK